MRHPQDRKSAPPDTSPRDLRFEGDGGFGKVFPGDEDEAVVLQEFLEFGVADEVEIVLTPFGTPVGMIEGGALDLGVVVSEVNDELIGAGRKRLQHFFVGVEPLRLGSARAKFEDAVEDDGIRRKGLIRVLWVMREEHGKFVGLGGGKVDLDEVGRADDGAHVGVEMREANAGGEGFVDLGVDFGFDIGHFGMFDNIGNREGEIAVRVEEAGVFGLRGDGRPAVTGPVGVESEVNTEVSIGMRFGPLRNFGKPRAWDHDAGGGDPVIIEGFFGGGVDGMHHAEIVSVDDKETGIGGIAETLCEGDGVVGWVGCGLLSEKRSEEKQEDSKGTDKTGHGASGLWER